MASFHQKMDNVKESLASLFKSRRSRRRSRCSSGSASSGSCASSSGNGNCISTPQNVKRVMHVTFDAQKRSFDGIPADWRPYFDAAAATAASASTVHEEETAVTAAAESRDDSGVSMATDAAASTPTVPQSPQQPLSTPKELLSLTYDRGSGSFVDLPTHWQERLQRNNLLTPEFQKNPDLLVAIFGLMDQELRAMQQEGFSLDRAMYSSSPSAAAGDGCCDSYVYEIEADRSNSSSEQDLPPAIAADDDDDDDDEEASGGGGGGARRPSLVWMRAVSAPSCAAHNKQP